VTDADHRSESLLETAGRLVLRGAGLTGYDVQSVIYDEYGRLLARVDLAWPAEEVAVESTATARTPGERCSATTAAARMPW